MMSRSVIATAGRPEEDDELAFPDLDVDRLQFQTCVAVVRLGNIRQFQFDLADYRGVIRVEIWLGHGVDGTPQRVAGFLPQNLLERNQ